MADNPWGGHRELGQRRRVSSDDQNRERDVVCRVVATADGS